MPETKEFLEGLEKNARIVAVVDAIVNRRQRIWNWKAFFSQAK